MKSTTMIKEKLSHKITNNSTLHSTKNYKGYIFNNIAWSINPLKVNKSLVTLKQGHKNRIRRKSTTWNINKCKISSNHRLTKMQTSWINAIRFNQTKEKSKSSFKSVPRFIPFLCKQDLYVNPEQPVFPPYAFCQLEIATEHPVQEEEKIFKCQSNKIT